jgi:glycine cleavage system transcriptional repressor
MTEFAVTAIGRDRPGIVAAVTGVLLDLGGNLEDSRMAILGGHFAVMLLVDLPEEAGRGRLEDGLGEVRERLGLEAVSVSEVERLAAEGGGPTHVLTVYGADRPGIVHGIATALADRRVNVTDLATQVTGGTEPVYVMMLELALGDVAEDDLEAALGETAEELQVDVSLRPLETEEL